MEPVSRPPRYRSGPCRSLLARRSLRPGQSCFASPCDQCAAACVPVWVVHNRPSGDRNGSVTRLWRLKRSHYQSDDGELRQTMRWMGASAVVQRDEPLVASYPTWKQSRFPLTCHPSSTGAPTARAVSSTGHQATFAHSSWASAYRWLAAHKKTKVVEILTSGLH